MFKAIESKYLLLDTNVLINAVKYAEYFTDFFTLLEESSVEAVLDNTIKFEFLRGCKTKADFDLKNSLLEKFFRSDRLELSVDREIFDNAVKIANCYARKDSKYSKQISFGDCLIAAQLKKYKNKNSENLFLATSDIQDFPTCIFDRLFIYTIDTEDSIVNIAICSFNRDKYKKALSGLRE